MPTKDRTKRARQQARFYQTKKALGLCVGCWQCKATKGVRCNCCYELHRQRKAAREARYKAEGKCLVCGQSVYLDRTTCFKHRRWKEASRMASISRFLTKEEAQCLRQAHQSLRMMFRFLKLHRFPTASGLQNAGCEPPKTSHSL